MKLFGVTFDRDIHRIQLAHSLRSVVLSFAVIKFLLVLLFFRRKRLSGA